MNRKQFLILVIALLVLGGASLALFWQDISEYRASGARIGAKLVPDLKVADVAQVELKGASAHTLLVRKDTGWVVQERNGYPADFKAISDLIIKLIELKVVQAEPVGESLWPRVELVAPGKGEGAGTQVEFKDASGKTLVNLIVGKTILKKDPGNPLPSAQNGVPAGRYIRIVGANDKVVVVSDPLTQVDAQPGHWIDKKFVKVERVKTLAVAGEGMNWKITRGEEWEPWKLAGGADAVNPTIAVTAANALGSITPKDVAGAAKPEGEGTPVSTITAETFDNLVYTFRAAKRKSGSDYLVSVALSGAPPATRTPEKDEKPADKEKRDKEFAENRKRLEAKIALEKILTSWSYVVDAKELDPILKPRDEIVVPKRPAADKGVK